MMVGAGDDRWSKEVRIIVLVVVLLAVLVLIWLFRGAINPLIISALLAYIMLPGVDFLRRRTRLKRRTAVFLVYTLTLLLLLSIPAAFGPLLMDQLQELAGDLSLLVAGYQEWSTAPLNVMRWTLIPADILPPLPQASPDLINSLVNNLFALVGAVTKNFFWVLIVLVTTYYLLADGSRLVEWLLQIPPPQYQRDARILYTQLNYVWGDYLRSQLAFMLVVGVLDALVWLAIGLPGAILLGLITGLTSFVHEIGAIVSGVLSVLVAWLAGSHFLPLSNFWFAILVFVLYMVLTAIKNIWLRPVITGRGVHLHPGIVFVVILAALVFYGALAAFIAVPLLVSLLVLGRYLRRRLLGLPPFPEGQDPAAYFPQPAGQESPVE